MKKQTLQLILVLLVFNYTAVSSSHAAAIVQESGVNNLTFQGEAVDLVLNPDVSNDIQNSVTTGSAESPIQVWTVVTDGAALDGHALHAPPSPHKQLADMTLQESVAVFPLIFSSAGTYRCYMRVRNDGTPGSGSTDSMWAPSDWDETNPSDALSTGTTGNYEWKEPGSFLVSTGQLGSTLEFRVGVRESSAHLDAVVFSQQTGLDDETLDSMAGGITAEPPGAGCVSTMAELNSAIAAAQPGDTIMMCNGVWSDTVIDFDTDGLPGQPITLRAEVDGQVTLEGTSKLQIAGDYLVVRGLHFTNGLIPGGGNVIEFRGGSSDLANHSRLTECAITDYNPVDPSTNYKWVSVYGLYNRVDHCSFSGMNHIGVTLTVWLGTGAPANHTRIDNNIFADRTEGTGNGFETIRIGTSTRSMQDSEAIVESNYFYRCDGEIEIISNKSVGNLYRRNTFESCNGQLTLRHGTNCVVEGNFFFGNGVSGSSGVRVIGSDHVVINNYFENLQGTGTRAALAMMNGVPNSPLNRYLQVERALVAFNTFYGCKDNFVIGTESSDGDTTLPPKDSTIANNVVKGSDAPLIEYVNTPINMQYEGNIFHGASLGITQPAGIMNVDPLLSLASDGLMRPATNSPVIDAAAGSYTDVLVDMDGDARVFGSQDIGADEVISGPHPFAPVGPNDVGPRWLRPSTLIMLTADVAPFSAEITFEDSTGLAPYYELRRSENLTNDTWDVVATYIPAGHTSTVFNVTDPTTNGPAAFWRISRD